MKIDRRLLLKAGAAAIVPATAFEAAAQEWPSRPIRMIVGFPAGGVADIWARVIATPMQHALGQPVVVVNQAGASGQIAHAAVAKAAPDGYTLVVGSAGPLATGPALQKVPYDSRRDFVAVGMIGDYEALLMANPGFAPSTLAETIAYARANPGKLRFAVGSPGSVMHLLAARWVKANNLDVTWIPYKGTAQAIGDLVGGVVDVLLDGFPAALAQVNGGRLKAIAVSSPTRSPVLPNTPTFIEAGFPGYVATNWISLNAPAGTPRPALERLNTELNKVLRDPAVRENFAKQSSRAVPMGLDEAQKFITGEIDQWARVAAETGVKIE